MSSLNLNEDFRHFDKLIWQVPSWGIAIAAGVIVAADRIGKIGHSWVLAVNYIQALILFFGSFLLAALAIALYKYRCLQAACAPDPIPSPPFRLQPSANTFLQGALCLTCGGVFGLGAVQVFCLARLIIAGLIVGALFWFLAEVRNRYIVEEINKNRKATGNKTLQPTR
jgi:hypothetical protein